MQLNHSNGFKRTSRKPKFQLTPLYIQVRDTFAEDIESGVWAIGTQLPEESELARQFGISAGTVRKALDMLEAEGFLERKQGRGTFVIDKEANEAARRVACTKASLLIIKRASDEVGHNTTPELATLLQSRIADALFAAGYSGEAS